MKFLIDTCVLSELRHPRGDQNVKNRVNDIPENDLFVSVITLGEIVKGISLLENGPKKKTLQAWVHYLEKFFVDRILPIDLETTYTWGQMSAIASRRGRALAVCDGLIAASSIRHELHVMTRNLSDFELTEAKIFNPWDS